MALGSNDLGDVGSKLENFRESIAVFEASDSARECTRNGVKALGYRLAEESSLEDIEQICRGENPPRILIVSLPQGQKLVETLQALSSPPVMIASLSASSSMGASAKSSRAYFSSCSTPLYSLRPHHQDSSLGPVLQAAEVLYKQALRIEQFVRNEKKLKEQLREHGHSGAITGFQHFAFFKRLLVLEIKRAKRYGYSIAICVLQPDENTAIEPGSPVEKNVQVQLADAVTSSIRDIDLAVDLKENQMLVFLPFTDTRGATEVGQRILRCVRESVGIRLFGESLKVKASLGVGVMKADEDMSFSTLLREAKSALESARIRGGNRVVSYEGGA